MMEFPIYSRDRTPEESAVHCLVCGRKIAWNEWPERITLGSGAILNDSGAETGGPSDQMEGFITLFYHASSQHHDSSASLIVATDVVGGQVDLDFCSTECLRAFFDSITEEMQRRVIAAKQGTPRGAS